MASLSLFGDIRSYISEKLVRSPDSIVDMGGEVAISMAEKEIQKIIPSSISDAIGQSQIALKG